MKKIARLQFFCDEREGGDGNGDGMGVVEAIVTYRNHIQQAGQLHIDIICNWQVDN